MTRRFVYSLYVLNGLVQDLGMDTIAASDLPDLSGSYDPLGSATAAQAAAIATSEAYTDSSLTSYVPKTTTVNGHALSSNVTVTSSDVGLGSVTNDAQTKASIVPNTAPTAGQILIGNAGNTAYAKQTISGSGATITLGATGTVTISAIANASLANSTVTISGHSVALGGSLNLAAGDVSGLAAIATSGAITDATGTLLVGHGGTAQTSFTAHGVILGNGSSGLGVTAVGPTNQVLIGNTGADPSWSSVTESFLSLADVATANSSTSMHGFLKKLDNTATHFMDGTGNWSTPAGSATATPLNILDNSGLWFAQEQAPATLTTIATEGYGPDCFRMPSQTASTQYVRVDTNGAQETGLTTRYYGQFKQITGAGKFMVFQPLEGLPTYDINNQTVTLQVLMKASGSKTIRLGAFYLTSAGTMDTLPATTVASWNANSTDPTLGTNESYITVSSIPTGAGGTISGNAANCSVTTSWQNFAVTFTVTATAKNLCLAVWTDSQFSAGDILSTAQWGLYQGSSTVTWSPMDPQAELHRVLRFYEKSFAIDTAPAQASGTFAGCLSIGSGANTSAGTAVFKVEKRAVPTFTTYNPTQSATSWRNGADSGNNAIGTIVVGTSAATIPTNGATAANSWNIHWTAKARL